MNCKSLPLKSKYMYYHDDYSKTSIKSKPLALAVFFYGVEGGKTYCNQQNLNLGGYASNNRQLCAILILLGPSNTVIFI